MAIPFSAEGRVSYPPDDGQEPVSIDFSLAGTYDSILEATLQLSGSATTSVPFGTVGGAGAKVVYIEYDADPAGLPIQLRINGGTENHELSPGGVYLHLNPTPVNGVTALSIVHTTNATVRVRLLR